MFDKLRNTAIRESLNIKLLYFSGSKDFSLDGLVM